MALTLHTDACKDASGALICGIASDDDADGRTIGKKAMYVGTLADGRLGSGYCYSR